MSGSMSPTEWIPPDNHRPEPGWYPEPAVGYPELAVGYPELAGWYPAPAEPGLLRWWDGQAWTAATCWPLAQSWPHPYATPPPRRLALWLSSPAGSVLLGTVAAVTAAGWAAAAALIAFTALAGRPVAGITPAFDFSMAVVLPFLDAAAAFGALAIRPALRYSRASRAKVVHITRRPAPPDGESARRAPALVRARSAGRRFRRPFTSLPRLVGQAFAAVSTATVLGGSLFLAWSLSHGDIPSLDTAGPTAHGQQMAAIIWMAHFLTWCGVACRQLNRNRATSNWLP